MVGAGVPERFVGYWRITEMELWDADYLDLVVPAYFEFDREQMGEFQFGTVRGVARLSIQRARRRSRC